MSTEFGCRKNPRSEIEVSSTKVKSGNEWAWREDMTGEGTVAETDVIEMSGI